MIFDLKRSTATGVTANWHVSTEIGRLTIPLGPIHTRRLYTHIGEAAMGGAPKTSLGAVTVSSFSKTFGIEPFTVIRGEGVTVTIQARPADWQALLERIGDTK